MSVFAKSAFAMVLASAAATVCFSAVRADILRVAIVAADSEDDYKTNVALLPTFVDLLKKGGAKTVSVGSDAEHKSIATTSVWATPADLAKLTGSDDWKAAAGKLKRKSYTTEVFEVAP